MADRPPLSDGKMRPVVPLAPNQQLQPDTLDQFYRPGLPGIRWTPPSASASATQNAATNTTVLSITNVTEVGGTTVGEAISGFATTAIAPGVNQTGAASLSHDFSLVNVQVSTAARVRLYASAAARDADVGRPPSVQVTPGLSNQLISAHNLTGLTGVPLNFPCSPAILGRSSDGNVYWSVTNMGLTTVAITVTLTWLQLGTL